MGGQSAVHEIFFTRSSAEKFSISEIHCGQSAKGPRTVRLCWANSTRDSFSQLAVYKIQRRTVCQDIADSPRLDRKVGSARLDLYWMSLSLPSTKPHTNIQKLSLFLSQARGGDHKVKTFWSGSRTVRAHPRTLLKIVHHVLSVFQ